MTGEREDITLRTDDALLFRDVKSEIEAELGTDLDKVQALRVLIKHSEYGANPAEYGANP